MMKKAIALLLTLALVIALPVAALGNPGQNPNRNPGSPQTQVATITITVTGGGNNLVIRAINANGETVIIPRAGNGTWTQTGEAFGYTFIIRVQGNSLREVTITGFPEPERTYNRLVRTEFEYRAVASVFLGTSEVEGSREFVGGAATVYNWYRNNNFPGVNGQAVRTGATVTGTLNYQFNRNYLERFERFAKEVVTYVWCDGEVKGEYAGDWVSVGLVDGDEYYTGPFAGSRAISVSGGQIILHMGFQGGLHDRTADVTIGAFTVNFELLNTGNSPTNTVVRITAVDLSAL